MELPPLRYTMGFKVNNTNIPDPSVFSGAESDLDTMGERNANGMLIRNRVAKKAHLKMEYHNIPWSAIQVIGLLLADDNGTGKFSFTFPSPFRGSTILPQTIQAYAGDRDYEAVWSPENEMWIGNLSFSVIEY